VSELSCPTSRRSASLAWLRPDRECADLDAAIHRAGRIEQDAHSLLDRYAITTTGRDALARAEAMENLFGPWPTVAEVFAILPALAVLS
jgi:hypothetical protein